jgi:hypothetical protein
MQKAVILATCNITRTLLKMQDWNYNWPGLTCLCYSAQQNMEAETRKDKINAW